MSTNNPGGSRRRRIAGERRPSRPVATGTPTEPLESTAETDSATQTAPPVAAPAPPAADRDDPPAAVPADREASGSEAVASARRPGWWGSNASIYTFAGLLAALMTLASVIAAVGVLTADIREVRDAEAAERASQTAPATAERAAEAILAYDHQTLEADQDAAARFMTDDFAEQYAETFEKVVRPTAEESRATVTATVQGSATVRASSDRVRVLLFVDQTTVSRANENPQVALNRVEMVMERSGDSWLVDDITSY